MAHPSIRSLVIALALIGPATGCSKKGTAEKPSGLGPGPGSATAAVPQAPPPAPVPPPPAQEAQPTAQGEAEEVPSAPDPAKSVGGTITLPAARKKNVSKGDTIFIVARRAGGPPGPASMLAVQKHIVDEFPMRFSLSGRDSMIPGTPFEGEISITVRVDKDGDAMTRRKGDVMGQVNGVKVGSQDVAISLDTVQKEDQTLGPGSPGGGGMRPPGALPPGHP